MCRKPDYSCIIFPSLLSCFENKVGYLQTLLYGVRVLYCGCCYCAYIGILHEKKLLVFRGVGCIFYEMACGRPLFPGSTVEDELRLIFRALGSPPADAWGGLAAPYASPQCSPDPLLTRAPRLDADALELLSKFLCVSS